MRGGVALGCDRLGSVNGLRGAEAERLLAAALEMGVRVFDTAPVYGQGDSERLLGRVLAPVRDEVAIVTKVGQFFPAAARLLLPLKGLAHRASARSPRLRGLVAARRAGVLPRRFDRGFIEDELRRSLRRLRTDRVDALLLHSPDPEQPATRDGLATLARLRDAGAARRVGVSTETAAEALAALACPLVEVVEFPLEDGPVTEAALAAAARQGIEVILRGALRHRAPALRGADAAARRAILAEAVGGVLSRPGATTLLVGTTRAEHLREVVAAARDTRPEGGGG